MNEDRFKILRRNSLRNEVDGNFDELEAYEDRSDLPNTITHQECVMLNRVLSDKSKLPPPCVARPTSSRGSSCRKPSKKDKEERGLQLISRRLTGGAPGAFNVLSTPREGKKELGGVVTEEQCRTLADYLIPSVGGLYLLPGACSGMLKESDAEESAQYEKDNAEVYSRLKKRNTYVAKAGYPPTAC